MSNTRSNETVSVTLAGLALVAATSPVVATSQLHHAATRLGDALESVRIEKQLEVDLLLHGHVGHLAEMAGAVEHVPRRGSIEASLAEGLFQARRHVGSDAERRVLAGAARAVDTYMSGVHGAEADGAAPDEVMRRTRAPLDQAFAGAQELVRVNRQQAHAALTGVRRWDRLSNVGGVAIAIVLIGGVAGVLVFVHASLQRPLLQTRHAIARFGAGERGARAREAGPVELREIARAFNEMATALAHQRAQQLQFLAGVAHDLRNPLSALGAAAGLLGSHRPVPPPARLYEIGALIGRQVKGLGRMLEDFLDATRIESGRLDLRLEVRDARDLVREAVELYGAVSPRHEVALVDAVGGALLPIHGDPVRIEQVLGNLISNAIKYSPHGSRIEVRVARNRGEAVLEVRDEGIGIAPEDQARVFEPFRRTSASRDAFPGAGLGLSVARRIIEAHRGHIELTSTLGEGTTFRVRLPVASTGDPALDAPGDGGPVAAAPAVR